MQLYGHVDVAHWEPVWTRFTWFQHKKAAKFQPKLKTVKLIFFSPNVLPAFSSGVSSFAAADAKHLAQAAAFAAGAAAPIGDID